MSQPETPIRIAIRHWPAAEAPASAIRRRVFIDEQGIDPDLEMDGRDPDCLHALATVGPDGNAVGTGRLLPDGRIGRLAVLPDWRHRGIASALLTALIQAARNRGDRRIHLHAQSYAAALYIRAGFTPIGDEFTEAGIPHIEMQWTGHPA